jgi:transposase-like protein
VPKKTETYNKIRMAIVRIEKGRPKVVSLDRKMSVTAVAEEAGVSDSLIHKDYTDLLERIKKNQDKGYRSERNKKHDALKTEREKNRLLRQEIEELKLDNANLVSINVCLEEEIDTLTSVKNSKNVVTLKGKN